MSAFVLNCILCGMFIQNGWTEENRMQQPVFEPDLHARFTFGGFVGDRVRVNLDQWLMQVPGSNPAILQMFRDRDRKPRKNLVPWAGEFAGKYLISLVQALRMTECTDLRTLTRQFVDDLIAVQDADGYLGPHPRHERFTGKTEPSGWHTDLWDFWGHYHCMLGLYLWYKESGYEPALAACRRSADLICRLFLNTGRTIHSAGAEEMNMAVSHIFCILYEETGERRYLDMARQIEKEWEVPPAGDYVRAPLAGKEFFEMPKPRWESLHDIQAIAELYFITGEEKYKKAFEHIWWSIVKGDRHNTGGFSSGEKATGNPYDRGAIETCCTVAWIALSIDMLRMTGNPLVADEIELSTLNGNIGGQAPSGHWWTYNTPMDGVKRSSDDEINFQSQIGGPWLNCCSVNAPRGLGMLSEWAVMQSAKGIVLNHYGPGEIQTTIPSGDKLVLRQETNYPVDGNIQINVELSSPGSFEILLRIPSWSRNTRLSVNGNPVSGVEPGTYAKLAREWRNGDRIDLEPDMSLHYWAGEKECNGKISIYHGPLLLTFDQRFNTYDADEIPTIDIRSLTYKSIECNEWPAPWILFRFTTLQGRELVLCDFASAGSLGTYYKSWLPGRGIAPVGFSPEAPVWTSRIEKGN